MGVLLDVGESFDEPSRSWLTLHAKEVDMITSNLLYLAIAVGVGVTSLVRLFSELVKEERSRFILVNFSLILITCVSLAVLAVVR